MTVIYLFIFPFFFFCLPPTFFLVSDSQDTVIAVIKNTHQRTRSPSIMHQSQAPVSPPTPPHPPHPSPTHPHPLELESCTAQESSERNCPKFDPVASFDGVSLRPEAPLNPLNWLPLVMNAAPPSFALLLSAQRILRGFL